MKLLYRAGGNSARLFRFHWSVSARELILTLPGRKVRLRRDATGAPIQRPEWQGGGPPPPKQALLARKAKIPRAMGGGLPYHKGRVSLRFFAVHHGARG